jgi:dihydrofolate reductase
MTKIIESTLISSDGVVNNPGDWALAYFNEEFTQEATMLLGRGTYEDLSWRWPSQTGSFADAINGIRKYVFSSEPDLTSRAPCSPRGREPQYLLGFEPGRDDAC